MRLTRLLLPITLLAALALTSSAFAELPLGTWDSWVIESYVTPWNSTTNKVDPVNPDYWHYDYIVWYESYDTGTTKWGRAPAGLDWVYVETDEFAGEFMAAGFFGVQDGSRTTSKITLSTESRPSGSSYPSDNVSLGTTLYDNTDFQGTAATITWYGYQDDAAADGGTISAYTWYIQKPNAPDQDDPPLIDDDAKEEMDPAVRTVYFHNRPDSTAGGSFTNSGLQTAWNTYINPIQDSSEDWATIQKEGAGVADNWFPLNGNNPGGSSGAWGTYKADSGYNRPIAWVWMEFTAPPGPVTGWAKDGDISGNEVWGPTPELNPAFLLMLTLLPAGLLLRKRD